MPICMRCRMQRGTRRRSEVDAVDESVDGCRVPSEGNYLLNVAHDDFEQFDVGEPVPFDLDRRLMEWPFPEWIDRRLRL